jgi:hypothetical protein
MWLIGLVHVYFFIASYSLALVDGGDALMLVIFMPLDQLDDGASALLHGVAPSIFV